MMDKQSHLWTVAFMVIFLAFTVKSARYYVCLKTQAVSEGQPGQGTTGTVRLKAHGPGGTHWTYKDIGQGPDNDEKLCYNANNIDLTEVNEVVVGLSSYDSWGPEYIAIKKRGSGVCYACKQNWDGCTAADCTVWEGNRITIDCQPDSSYYCEW